MRSITVNFVWPLCVYVCRMCVWVGVNIKRHYIQIAASRFTEHGSLPDKGGSIDSIPNLNMRTTAGV